MTSREPSSAGPVTAAGIPIVGIGASAGGLAAFEAFFSAMPPDAAPGMAFVLVQHLAPDHKSMLTALVQRYTRMQVFEVEGGMVVQPHCAYIIPPGHDMAFLNGSLQLLESTAPRGQRLTIDYFFRSLAQDQHERAIGIVLSGTGSDGTLGVRAIKAEGGMVMVQTPASTEFDGMPRSALATGLVDYELAPADMPAALMAYVARAFGTSPSAATAPQAEPGQALKKIFVLLRAQTGHDFSQYKPNTLQRRIERRLAVHQIDGLDAYVSYLQKTAAEVDALFRDLLIGVTHFFRDAEAFRALEAQVIPGLLAGKPAEAPIRVWSLGCSTGEEAYSIAILLQEHLQALAHKHPLQVFATDIDSRAIATARAGRYPASMAVDVSAQRLERCFTVEDHGNTYRINKSIRDVLVFSEQNAIKDPPFSRLDLLCCRNVMIYMGAELQKKLIPLFHYALRPGGFLLLGTSESIGDFGDLFTTLDRQTKLYQRRDDVQGSQRPGLSRFLPPVPAPVTSAPPLPGKYTHPVKTSLRQITEQALLQRAPAAALVNGQGDIFYIHGRTGLYLEPAAGDVTINNILAMARDGLKMELVLALRRCVNSGERVLMPNLRVRSNGHHSAVNLSVCPVSEVQGDAAIRPLYLVMLEALPSPDPEPPLGLAADGAASAPGTGSDADALIAALRRELRSKDEYLQTTHEALETSNEELKSSNEEMQSVNEELQSTNEELETSKEELQSINEELATVNTELQTKVLDLSRTNNDMNNLMAGTGIATVFVDHGLKILRFTPAATRIINLIAGDVGRPVGHIVSNLIDYDTLLTDAQTVLDTLVPKAVEVQTRDQRWYSLHMQPYRTLDNVIEGAVITFVDITEMKRVAHALSEAQALARLALASRDAIDAITVQGLDGRILGWNPAAVRLYGWSEAEALTMHAYELLPEPLREAALVTLVQLGRPEAALPLVTQRLNKAGEVLQVRVTATALVDEVGQRYAVATTERLFSGKPEPTSEGGVA